MFSGSWVFDYEVLGLEDYGNGFFSLRFIELGVLDLVFWGLRMVEGLGSLGLRKS